MVSEKAFDVVHLTFIPPFASGSYNRLVGAQIRGIAEYRQAAISYWNGPIESGESNGSLFTVNRRGLSLGQRMYLQLPERVRRYRFNGIGGRESLIYLWHVLSLLPRLKPKIIVCYDGYKLGPLLRRVINWPCRIILSQHGLSYYLPASISSDVYSLKSFDAVWVLTNASYQVTRNSVSAYEPVVRILPNGIDIEQFKPVTVQEKRRLRDELNLPQDRKIILLLSRLVPKKAAHLILYSWQKILDQNPEAFLWIVGGGDLGYEYYVRNLVDSLGISETVRLEGRVHPTGTPACYQASDLYVLPTVAQEGMGLSALEAMSCGLPCIVSDYEAARELFPDDVVLFVPNPNVEDVFVAPIIRLLRSCSTREEMGKRARLLVEQHYSLDLWLDRLREFYRKEIQLAGVRR